MSVSKAVVSRPVLWLVVFSLIVITGIFLLPNIPIEMYPEIEAPYLVVVTVYKGADPETVEKSVTDLLEGAVANTSGIIKMTSESRSQTSSIVLEFEYGTDIDVKINRVREYIDRVVSDLPEDVDPPMIMQVRPDDMPIMRIAVLGTPESNLSQNDLRFIAKNQLENRFRQLEGVASALVEGGQDPVVRVDFSQNRLEAYGITITEIARAISAQNLELGAGYIEEGLIEYTIKTVGEFASIEEIANTVVLQKAGSDIRLMDIGEVYFGYEEERSSVFVNGEPGVYVSIMKQSGANTIKVADQIYRLMENIKSALPENVYLELTQDDTIQTRAMLRELINSILIGMVLSVVVLVFFLRNVNSSIIISLAIPLSFVIVLFVMSLAGITINMMTLAGLILGLGMTVDCSIVVIESVISQREKGEKPTIAATLAGDEVMSSLIAATLTQLCVFVPIILFKDQLELVGILVQDMVFTICVSVLASLFLGVLLVPVLVSKWLPVHSRLQKPLRGRFVSKLDRSIDKSIKGFTGYYVKLLNAAMKHRLITIFLVLCAFLGSVFAMGMLESTVMPDQYTDQVVLEIDMPLGTRYSDTKAVMLELKHYALQDITGYKNIIGTVGNTGDVFNTAGVNNAVITVVMNLDDPAADNEDEVKAKLRSHFNKFPDASFNYVATGLLSLLGSSDIDIMFNYDDISEGIAQANAIRHILETQVPEVQDIVIDMDEGLPQVNVNIDRNRAYNMGVNIASIAMEIAASMNSVTASTLRLGGDEYDIILQLTKDDRYEIPDLGRVFVRSSKGNLIPVSNFATLDRDLGPVNVNRESQVRAIHVTADVIEGYPLSAVQAKIAQLLEENDIKAIFTGSMEDTADMMRTFGLVIILALILVYGVMAAQYESFKDPFINFCTIPLIMIGVVLIHILTNSEMSAFTMMGIVLLAGLVTSNGILLVDCTNQLIQKGKGLFEACVEAGRIRFRPVIMSSLTTMLALVPMAFFPGKSSTITAPIGLVVFGGLASSTIITLVFVPVLYSIFHGKKRG